MTLSLDALGRLQLAAWVAAVVLCAAVVVRGVAFSDEVPFLSEGDSGAWISAPIRPTADLIAVMPDAPPTSTFVRRFDGAPGDDPARLRGRALRRVDILLNGERVDVRGDGIGWKQPFDVDVTALLRPGRNELRASVRNVHGPGLLQLALVKGDLRIETDEQWQVVTNRGNPVAAVRARDTNIHPESRLLPPVARLLVDHAPMLVLMFAGFSIAAWFAAARVPAAAFVHAPRIVLGAIGVFWLLVYFVKGTRMPVMLGFDAHAHLAYIDYLLAHFAPPTAAYGFSTYHPPIFHALTAAVVGATGVTAESPMGPAVYRMVPMLGGLTTVCLTYVVSLRIWPGESLRPSLAVATAGLLPMNVYMATYVSNEALHATWVSLALTLATKFILAPHPVRARAAALGGVLGLGLLTKFTSLAIAPLIAALTGARLWLIDGKSALRGAGTSLAILAIASAVAGWFYVRNWLLFGDPLVWNLDVPGAATWWMLPGFHTSDAYLHFGASVDHPFFAGFESFWDGVYSTLWGDGLVAGMIRISTRHPFWHYEFMSLVYPLALPATALFALGFVRLVVQSLRDRSIARRLVLTMMTALPFVLSFSLLLITLRLPFYAQAKAPYVLATTLPLALCAADGLGWLPRRLVADASSRPWVALYFGWLATLACMIGLSFLG
jgi:hypothetical protein